MTSEHHDHRHCLALFEKLSEYIDNELDEATRREIEAHLEDCIQCKVCLETLKRSVAICRHSTPQSPPASLSRRLAAMIARLEVETLKTQG